MYYKSPATGCVGSCQKDDLVQNLMNKLLEQLQTASSSAAASSASSSGTSVTSEYLKRIRAELRRQHPEGREAWLRVELDSLLVRSGKNDKPSSGAVCGALTLLAGCSVRFH